MADCFCTDIFYCLIGHSVVDDIHQPGGNRRKNDHYQNPGQIIPHHLEVNLFFGNNLVDRVSEKNRDIKLKDHGNSRQYDTEDQKKTVSSDKTEYLEKGFAAFSSGCVVCGYFAHTVTSVMIPSAPAEVYLAFSSGN